jgi:hypothetical protein
MNQEIQTLEWENAQFWGEVKHPHSGLINTYSNGRSDIFTKPYVDDEGTIYTDKFCLDSHTWTEAIEIGKYKRGMKFINFIESV